MTKFILIFLVLFSFGSLATPYQFELRASNKYERSELANLGYALESVQSDKVTVYGTEKDIQVLQNTGQLISFKPITRDELQDYPDYDERFHNFGELTLKLQNLAASHSDLMKLESIGTSLEGRPIHHVILSENPENISHKPALALMGGHHAREHISVELPLGIIEHFLRQYRSGNQQIQNLLGSRVVHIIPVVNPDGAEHDISEGDYKWWRKNRRVMSEAVGVDLNRNYDLAWGTTGTSDRPGSDVYHGPSPFSEPETQAIKNFVESHTNISILVSFHTYSELILYPWGHTYDPIPNQTDHLVHKTMAETMARWNGYTPQQSSSLYPASGDTTDWSYGVHGIFSFTFELDPKNRWDGGFYPGQSKIDPVINKNLQPILYLTELADNPYRAIQTESQHWGFQTPVFQNTKKPTW